MATSPLADLTYYANRSQGGVGADEVNSPRGQAFLTALRQYDPNASFRAVPDENSGSIGYTLDFNASKLPGAGGATQLGGTSGAASGADYQIPFSTVQEHMQLGNAGAVTNDPTYGRITQNTNIEQPSSLLDVLGPAAVALFGFGAPALLGGFEAGAGAGAGAGALDTGGDSFLGLTDSGFPAFQGVPASGVSAGDAFAGSALDPYPPLDTSSDSFLGLQNDGFPAFQGVPASGVSPTDAFAGSALASGGGSNLLGKIPQFINALSKVPGLGGGSTGGGGGAGGGGGGLLNVPPAQYGSLAAIVKKYYGGLLGQ